LVPKDHQEEMAYGESKWSRHLTPKGQTRDPNTLRAQYLEKQLENDAT